jgi:hypothetical protein
MSSNCRSCESLGKAYVDLAIWYYVENQDPPYTVPCAIRDDQSKLVRVKTTSKSAAIKFIQEAVDTVINQSECNHN